MFCVLKTYIFWLVCVAEETGLNLTLSDNLKDIFSCVEAHLNSKAWDFGHFEFSPMV